MFAGQSFSFMLGFHINSFSALVVRDTIIMYKQTPRAIFLPFHLKTGLGYKRPHRYTCVILSLTVEGLTSIL